MPRGMVDPPLNAAYQACRPQARRGRHHDWVLGRALKECLRRSRATPLSTRRETRTGDSHSFGWLPKVTFRVNQSRAASGRDCEVMAKSDSGH